MFSFVHFECKSQKKSSDNQKLGALSLRQKLGQGAFLAYIGGYRSLLASFYELGAYDAWQKVNWDRVLWCSQLCCELQPNHRRYWLEAAHQMSYNASIYFEQKLNPQGGVQDQRVNEYKWLGIQMLDRGLSYLPSDISLMRKKAEIYRDRLKDWRLAADCYLKVYDQTQRLMDARFAGYMLAKSDRVEDWIKSYQLLRLSLLSNDEKDKTPSLFQTLDILKSQFKSRQLDFPPAN